MEALVPSSPHPWMGQGLLLELARKADRDPLAPLLGGAARLTPRREAAVARRFVGQAVAFNRAKDCAALWRRKSREVLAARTPGERPTRKAMPLARRASCKPRAAALSGSQALGPSSAGVAADARRTTEACEAREERNQMTKKERTKDEHPWSEDAASSDCVGPAFGSERITSDVRPAAACRERRTEKNKSKKERKCLRSADVANVDDVGPGLRSRVDAVDTELLAETSESNEEGKKKRKKERKREKRKKKEAKKIRKHLRREQKAAKRRRKRAKASADWPVVQVRGSSSEDSSS